MRYAGSDAESRIMGGESGGQHERWKRPPSLLVGVAGEWRYLCQAKPSPSQMYRPTQITRIRLDSELFESASFARERRLSMEFTLPRRPLGMSISRFGQHEHKRRRGRMLK
jgi:hypothetical protein